MAAIMKSAVAVKPVAAKPTAKVAFKSADRKFRVWQPTNNK